MSAALPDQVPGVGSVPAAAAVHVAGRADRTAASARTDQGSEVLTEKEHTRQVRRRVLDAQLARLAGRADGATLTGRDAAARVLRLSARLERGDFGW